ncbi:MAG TPA: tRNA 2-thiouridine(34) synthase MnmA [Acidimicrobiia bacterium]|nr:tRNA 2-thiouridine(34) synthase MnmA [Acidimicrobiia bacterium]
MKAVVALSGGVDSSVAAALLAAAGHEVIAVTLVQWLPSAGCERGGCGCGDLEDARRVAARLGIEHRVLDCTGVFRQGVVEPFVAAYRSGLTPNPCIECNRRVRFGTLLEEAARLGGDLLATGHYARLHRDEGGFHLLRGADGNKDQSYVLFMLGQEQLARLAFPVGEMGKDEVRRRARALGLPSAGRPESQDLCFAGPDGYRAFLREHFPEVGRPGPIVDPAGREIGQHAGVEGFTIGQRRGLGIAGGEPHYVLEVDPATATVVVGAAADLAADGCRVGEASWVTGMAPAGDGLEVKLRYRSPAVAARLEPAVAGEWVIRFAEPQPAVTPGQAAVLYRGDEVMGGGTILSPLRGGRTRSIGP